MFLKQRLLFLFFFLFSSQKAAVGRFLWGCVPTLERGCKAKGPCAHHADPTVIECDEFRKNRDSQMVWAVVYADMPLPCCGIAVNEVNRTTTPFRWRVEWSG